MFYQVLILSIIAFPGILGENYYQQLVSNRKNIFASFSRIVSISVLSYLIRCLIALQQGYGEIHVTVFFENIDNIIKYILISIVSSFLLINSFIFLENKVLPLWKEKDYSVKEEGNEDE